ncbi:MAG: tetratricopeptide repeat protein [Novosphingobium meiothermophilum]|uniref:tetratricopeptide repeat protein n=1 Tax=Novosphingobium TaxID=165696 RepID=UPI000D6E2E5F|nr:MULTISPECIES: tetratricopeptide repeat protein [Novosphingobium]
MILNFRGAVALGVLALGIAGPAVLPVMAQSATTRTTTTAQTDPELRLRRMEAEIRALQRKVFPDGAGKTFVPEITPGQPAAAPAGAPASSAVTDILARLDAVEAQMMRLTAQVEEGQNRTARLEERLTRLEAAATPPEPVAVPSAAPAPTAASAPAGVRPAATGAQAPAAAQTAAPKPAQPSAARVAAVQAIEKPATADAGLDEYTYGFRLWEAKFYPEAQQQLQIYVDRYPRHNMISYGRNLLGRAWLDDGKPGTAAQFFLQNYLADKKGARAADSLLYLGIAMVRLKDTEKACGAFAEFAATYPAEAAGRLKSQYDAARASVKCK